MLGALEMLSIGVGGAVHVDVVQIIQSLTLHLKPLYLKVICQHRGPNERN